MINIFIKSALFLSLYGVAAVVFAQDNTIVCDQSENVDVKINDIFDLTDPDAIFLHNWANFLHIKTKHKTLLNEAAFFTKKCEVTEQDLAELERHLRSQQYLRDARVTVDETSKKIKVETWDNWSLLPTLDFGRKGGENKFAIGIQDKNFLGLGIDAELESFSDDQRSGYKFKSHFPLFLNNNIKANIRLTSNDDGTSNTVFLKKDFVSFDTQNAFVVGFDNFDQIDTLYQSGNTFLQYQHKQNFTTAGWYWLANDTATDTLRYGIGYRNEQHVFSMLSDDNANFMVDLPEDREFTYPFFNVDYLQKDYRKLTNVNLINHIEDFNFGWHFTADIGTDLHANNNAPMLILRSTLSKGIEVFDDAYWLFSSSLAGEYFDGTNDKNRLLLRVNNEYFHKINEQWGAYFKNESYISDNQYKDLPVTLGGDTSLRGFPLQYRHGDKSTQFTFEARYYPHINIYKLIELGGAAFIDVGRVFGAKAVDDDSSKWMKSIGLGVRFYSSHSSDARVIHFDVIKPMTSDPNVSGVEFRVTTKHTF